MSGRLAVVGLGPGDVRWLTPEADAALAAADALFGYGPYLDRAPVRDGQTGPRSVTGRAATHPTIAKKRCAPATLSKPRPPDTNATLAPAAAVCEQIESGPATWRGLDLEIVPGITAMLAVAARVGAPLGHDFCALSLSDNLKPWPVIERRLDAAAQAGFVIALYNPISRARPWQLTAALERLRRYLPTTTPIVFGRAVGRADENIAVTTLQAADPVGADMATLVIVGSAETRLVPRPGHAPLVYTPRSASA